MHCTFGQWDFSLSLNWAVFRRITCDTDKCKPRGTINSYGPADCLDWAIWFNSQWNFHIAKSPFGSYVWDLYSIYFNLLWFGFIPKTSERVWVVIAWSVIAWWIVWKGSTNHGSNMYHEIVLAQKSNIWTGWTLALFSGYFQLSFSAISILLQQLFSIHALLPDFFLIFSPGLDNIS